MPKLDLSWMHWNEHGIEVDAHEPQFDAGPSPTEKSFWIDCLPFSEIPLFCSGLRFTLWWSSPIFSISRSFRKLILWHTLSSSDGLNLFFFFFRCISELWSSCKFFSVRSREEKKTSLLQQVGLWRCFFFPLARNFHFAYIPGIGIQRNKTPQIYNLIGWTKHGIIVLYVGHALNFLFPFCLQKCLCCVHNVE